MKNNPVFQVLVASSDTILPAGGALETLAVGQLGCFNAETNLSVNIGAALPDKFYFAVGIPNAQGTLGDIRKSSGEYIRKSKLNTAYAQSAIAPASQVHTVALAGFVPAANKDYVFRLTFMSANTMYMQGFNHPVKSFVVSTGAVAPTLDALLDLMVLEINKDVEGIVVASKSGTSLVLTIGSEDKVATLAGLNPKYAFLRQFKTTLSIGGDFAIGDYTVTTTGPVYEQGSGYDIQQMEYLAAGWNGDPGIYRTGEINGLIGFATPMFAIAGTQYWTLRLNYEFESHSGGNLEYSNQLETVIATPIANTTLIAALVAMINTHNPVGGEVAVQVTTTTTTAAPVTTTTTTAG